MKMAHDLAAVVVNKAQSGELSTATYEIERKPCHKLPEWVHEFYMHFAIIYKRKWIDETDELELATKIMWYKVLSKELEPYGDYESVIMDTINDAAAKFSWPPSPAEFLEVALVKARSLKEKREDALKREDNTKLLIKVADPEYAKRMLKQIREQMHTSKGTV